MRRNGMEDIDFSDEFCGFLQDTIPAVRAAELLLLLRTQPAKWWKPAAAVALLGAADGLAKAECGRFLELFLARGLLAARPDGRVQYRVDDAALAAHVDKLAEAYRERPVTLIRMIYDRRPLRQA
jgi:hypothetical protein